MQAVRSSERRLYSSVPGWFRTCRGSNWMWQKREEQRRRDAAEDMPARRNDHAWRHRWPRKDAMSRQEGERVTRPCLASAIVAYIQSIRCSDSIGQRTCCDGSRVMQNLVLVHVENATFWSVFQTVVHSLTTDAETSSPPNGVAGRLDYVASKLLRLTWEQCDSRWGSRCPTEVPWHPRFHQAKPRRQPHH